MMAGCKGLFAALGLMAGSLALAEPFGAHPSGAPFAFDNTSLEILRFETLPGWAEDDHLAAWRPFLASCRRLLTQERPQRAMAQALGPACRAALSGDIAEAGRAKAFFETHFRPHRLTKLGDISGFVTAYYEPEVKVSYLPSTDHSHAFLKKPDDLVSGRAGGGFDSRAPAGRKVRGRLEPYHDRAAIEAGALDGQGLAIAWAHPTDVFFTQIQGSARLRFHDGTVKRINYAAYNGHRYTPIGRVLVERGVARREEMSMDFLRVYLAADEARARDLRAQNRSYVFFREVEGLDAEDGPLGAQGLPVHPFRSLAVDRAIHVYGTLFFLSGFVPTGTFGELEPFQRLMVAQDTGSAIVGPARGDLYLGTGQDIGQIAGRVRHPVDWIILLPLSLSLDQSQMPLPPERRTP